MKHFISRKDRIILSAIDIINELGIQGLSTKELAFRQQVNESALYRHFKSKDAIIEGVIEYFSQFDTAIYNSTIQKELNSKDKILKYIKAYLEYYEGYPAITAILLSYEGLSHDPIIKTKMNAIFNYRLNNIISLIEESQDKNEMSKLFSARELAMILFGYCNKVILQWRMSGCKDTFKQDAMITIKKLLLVVNDGIQKAI